jgi:hypothetical protein
LPSIVVLVVLSECRHVGREKWSNPAVPTGRQVRKKEEFSMKSQMLIVAGLCLAVGLTVVPLNAQTGGVQAKVPFNFEVLGKTFPSGAYTMIATLDQVGIEDATGTLVARVVSNQISGRSVGPNGQIIFHCYRDRCFLAELWSPTQENGRQLLTSRPEANLAKEVPRTYFAVLGEKPRN